MKSNFYNLYKLYNLYFLIYLIFTILIFSFVLTSAGCIEFAFADVPISSLAIGFGDNDLVKMFDNGKIGVKNKIIYPTYDKFGYANDDMALLELEKPLDFSSKVSPGKK